MFKIEGFDEISKTLETLSDNAAKLDGKHDIPFDELFNDDFINEYTHFSNIDLFLKKFNINSIEDFDNIDIELLDQHVKSNTQFPNWEEMSAKASEIWITERLYKDL